MGDTYMYYFKFVTPTPPDDRTFGVTEIDLNCDLTWDYDFKQGPDKGRVFCSESKDYSSKKQQFVFTPAKKYEDYYLISPTTSSGTYLKTGLCGHPDDKTDNVNLEWNDHPELDSDCFYWHLVKLRDDKTFNHDDVSNIEDVYVIYNAYVRKYLKVIVDDENDEFKLVVSD